MGKKKHAEHVNHERWLVSYADLLTLLFAFFVVLFASSVSDKKKTAQMASAMQTAFTEHGVFDAHAATPPLESGAGNSQGTPAPLMQPVQTSAEAGGGGKGAGGGVGDKSGSGSGGGKAVQQQVQQALSKALTNGSATVHQTAEGLTISLHEAGFFGSGTADIDPRMVQMLAAVAASLPDRDLRIEGHTDNQPIHSERFRSNWELSTARAAAIAEVLMSRSHVAPQHFSLAGYGPFRPVTGNDTAAGRAQNRRVDIVLLGSGAAENAAHPRDVSSVASHNGKAGDKDLPSVPFAGAPPSAPRAPEPAIPRILQLAPAADRAAAR